MEQHAEYSIECVLCIYASFFHVEGYLKWLSVFIQLVIHNTLEIRVYSCTDGSRNSQSFLLWCAVCSSYAFLSLENSLLRWRRKAVRRRFVCFYFMNVGQLQLSSGNSSPYQIYVPPLPASIPELKVRIRTAIKTITADMLQTVWNELDYRVDVCRITKGAHIEHL